MDASWLLLLGWFLLLMTMAQALEQESLLGTLARSAWQETVIEKACHKYPRVI